MAFNQIKYNTEYKKKKYDEMSFLVPKGKKQEIKDYAKCNGKSVSKLIIDALEQCYMFDFSDKK